MALFIALMLFMSIVKIFFHLICVYKSAYIDELAYIYPQVFAYKSAHLKPLGEDKLFQEIFEIIYRDLRIIPHKNAHAIALKHIGLRSFDAHNVPVFIKQKLSTGVIHNLHETIFISRDLLQKIGLNDEQTVWLLDQKGQKLPLQISSFHNIDDKSWVLLSNSVAKKLLPQSLFKYTTIVSSDDATTTKERYQKEYNIERIESFLDRVPFFNALAYTMITKLYGWVLIGLVLIEFCFFSLILRDIFKEFSKAFIFFKFFGSKTYQLLQQFVLCTTIYLSLVLMVSYLAYGIITPMIQQFVMAHTLFNIDSSQLGYELLAIVVLALLFAVIYYVSNAKASIIGNEQYR